MLKAVKFLAGAFLMMVGLASAQPAQAVEWKEHVMGDENAPVTMIEYASLTCPHCASFHNEVLPEIKEKLIDTGKLKLIYRDYPLDGVALRAAAIAQCAGEDRYFGVLGMLFKSQMTWARSQDPVASIKEVVRFAGMTGDAVDACIADQELIDGIVGSRMTGEQEFNVSSTPSFILDGELIEGSREAELFIEKVEDLID
ncbi:DsbA family protein [Thalassospira sp.]|uniref:DsbA family protein n=1 Tax=Thalassospira sp. TaxID=1912094 RepID=UPI001B28A0AD|nr:DsbA family protein [Thalassospira sp.]MBO6808169.1 DsbA family protein [Thalassospira sp.]MBO6839458.1 DsbA family protein [Thalassospira sp.]